MVEEQIVVDRRVVPFKSYGENQINLRLKTYTFASAEKYGYALEHLKSLVSQCRVADKGNLGLAFLYGYPGDRTFVHGADVLVFRNPKDENTMIHSWSFENNDSLKREDGVFCSTEMKIATKEENLRRALRNDLFQYVLKWPKLPKSIDKIPKF